MEQVNWKVEGMTCANCALTIGKFLENKGMRQVKVNLIGGDVHFETEEEAREGELIKGIEALGYKVTPAAAGAATAAPARTMNRFLRYSLTCAPFTLLLALHMIPALHEPLHFLMNPWVQLALCVPVYVIGMRFFGRSAWNSIRNGIPNMNVLVALGATAAFFFSVTGTVMNLGPGYQYYETAATIITFVFLGNFLEDHSIESTQRALHSLARSQKVMAHMIAFDGDHREVILPVENTQLRNGDLVLIKSGEQVPADCKILWGDATVNEAIITGESAPVTKTRKSALIGGSLIIDGTVKAQVTAAANDSVLANIINLVKRAQGEKPPIQQLADRISAIFIPVVVSITIVTIAANYIFTGNFTESLMRGIAVLVISCPCAMGLATPAAIAVGLGRAAKSGILFRNARSLESFRNIRQVVFDKTGTLTTGRFTIEHYAVTAAGVSDDQFRQILYSLEKYSNHPIAQCITNSFRCKEDIRWDRIEERKGLGMWATHKDGHVYEAGSVKLLQEPVAGDPHNVYLTCDGKLLGWIDVKDEVRPEAASVIAYLKAHSIKTILLSGDIRSKCEKLARELGMDEVIPEQRPEQKLEQISRLNTLQPTAMVGDGINDAPALAKAAIGISMSDASHIALQTADVVLMNNGLKHLTLSLGLGKHTFQTIKENLFWAFAYNVVAIPVAAVGLLGIYGPAYGALLMGLSDVVLALNSIRLYVKKVV